MIPLLVFAYHAGYIDGSVRMLGRVMRDGKRLHDAEQRAKQEDKTP